MNVSTKRWAQRLAASALAIAAMFGVSGCEGQVPQAQAPQGTDQVPDLTEAQEKKIRGGILDALDRADQAKSADGLDAKVFGPALDVRKSELQIAQATGTLDAKATIPRDISQTVIPTTAGWPRAVFSITTTTHDQQSKRLMVMEQSDAHSNYKLWGVARLFPGVTLPKFAIPSIGSQMGNPKDSGLIMTPEDAVAQYADVLANGGQSKYAGQFADDHFRSELSKLSQTVQDGMARNNGTQSQTFTPAADQMAVMRSADGGDLVVARIDSRWTRTAGEGRESQPASDEERALFGNGKATSKMQVSYVNVVALYIPAAHSGQKVTAVGAERQPIQVSAL